MFSKSNFFLAIAGYTNGIQLKYETSPADFLAQIRQAQDISHTCRTAFVRVNNSKDAVLGFNEALAAEGKYTDETFPYGDALYWADMGKESSHYVADH